MFTSQEGKKVPQVTFHTRQGDQWIDVTTDDLFKNKTVIVFSLPGAFTPTCSSSHLPRYNELSSVFKQHGVDGILCVSVNDTFVMNARKADQHAENITFVPDGNGEFTKGMNMLVEKADLGFGPRSWRYSMLVRDGVVEKMFVEPNKPGDPFEVSDADTMLKYTAPEFKVQESVSLFTKPAAHSAPKPNRCCKSAAFSMKRSCWAKTPPPSACAPSAAAPRCRKCSSAAVTSVAATIWKLSCQLNK